MVADILKFTDTPIIDESIEENECQEYDPINCTNLNNGDDIRINIESQDVFTHPSESYLKFEGRLTKLMLLLTPMQMRLLKRIMR